MTILNMLSQEDHSSHLISKSQAWMGKWHLTEVYLALIMWKDSGHKLRGERGGSRKAEKKVGTLKFFLPSENLKHNLVSIENKHKYLGI